MAECFGIGWRLGSEQDGGINRNGVAVCVGIRKKRTNNIHKWHSAKEIDDSFIVICAMAFIINGAGFTPFPASSNLPGEYE